MAAECQNCQCAGTREDRLAGDVPLDVAMAELAVCRRVYVKKGKQRTRAQTLVKERQVGVD